MGCLALGGLVPGGALVGSIVMNLTTTGGGLIPFVGFLILPLSFVGALTAWGIAARGVVAATLLLALLKGELREQLAQAEAVSPLMATVMVPVPPVVCLAGAGLVWVFNGHAVSTGAFFAIWASIGLGYGTVLAALTAVGTLDVEDLSA